jgi:hypothetical protein
MKVNEKKEEEEKRQEKEEEIEEKHILLRCWSEMGEICYKDGKSKAYVYSFISRYVNLYMYDSVLRL